MKYKPEEYINCGFYSDMDSDFQNHKEKLVKCRKPHICINCQKEIKKGEHALLETGFMDNKPVSCYTCTPCIDEWIEESDKASNQYGTINHSDHESYAIIKEELDETCEEFEKLVESVEKFWEMVKKDADNDLKLTALFEMQDIAILLACEAIQVSAMAHKAYGTIIQQEG